MIMCFLNHAFKYSLSIPSLLIKNITPIKMFTNINKIHIYLLRDDIAWVYTIIVLLNKVIIC